MIPQDLLLYLLQLVQALKYEDQDKIRSSINDSVAVSQVDAVKVLSPDDEEDKGSSTAEQKHKPDADGNEGNENERTSISVQDMKVVSESYVAGGSSSSLAGTEVTPTSVDGGCLSTERKVEEVVLNTTNPDLATFLIHRACENSTLVNYFYWYAKNWALSK